MITFDEYREKCPIKFEQSKKGIYTDSASAIGLVKCAEVTGDTGGLSSVVGQYATLKDVVEVKISDLEMSGIYLKIGKTYYDLKSFTWGWIDEPNIFIDKIGDSRPICLHYGSFFFILAGLVRDDYHFGKNEDKEVWEQFDLKKTLERFPLPDGHFHIYYTAILVENKKWRFEFDQNLSTTCCEAFGNGLIYRVGFKNSTPEPTLLVKSDKYDYEANDDEIPTFPLNFCPICGATPKFHCLEKLRQERECVTKTVESCTTKRVPYVEDQEEPA